jgi:hypothetical protein
MIVKELLNILSLLPEEMEIVYESTSKDESLVCLKSIVGAEEITTNENEKFLLLQGFEAMEPDENIFRLNYN